MRICLAVLGSVATLLAVAGCTASSTGGPTTPRPTTPRPSPSAPSTSIPATSVPGTPSVNPTAPDSSTQTGAPPALAAIRGAVLLVGPTMRNADAYSVGATGLSRLTTDARLTAVTADRKRIIVATASRISELRGHTLHDLGLRSAFSPALSPSGALAWVALDLSHQTPGVTKPQAFVVHVATRSTTTARTVYRTTSSLGPPRWINRQVLVVAAANGTQTTLVRITADNGTTRTLATINRPDALALTAGPKWITVTQDDRALLVPDTGGVPKALPTGQMPLCWTGPSTLVTAAGSHLSAVTISGTGTVAAIRTIPTFGGNLRVYGADCSRVRD